jgi:hypothetical protein
MVKAVDRGMVIGDICLMEKRGGRSGLYRRADQLKTQNAKVKKKAKRKNGVFEF